MTDCIDDEIRPLYSSDSHSRHNAPIRVLVSTMVLKESQRLSDTVLFHRGRYDLPFRSSLGLMNLDNELPTESTHYLFRTRIAEYAMTHNENLCDTDFSQLTRSQGVYKTLE